MRSFTIACAIASISSVALAADLYVDSSGIGGPYLDIDSAMLASNPGDRILVRPGTYPAFHFSRGVSVIGLGTPSQVRVERVDFHPNIPNDHFACVLSNVEVVGELPESGIGISGNELSTGTFVLDGVIVNGGVFLRGGPDGFHLLMQNTHVIAGPGDGFSGEAFWFGGKNNTAEIVDCTIEGADASAEAGTVAGIGLRLAGGSNVRIARSEIFGGDGSAGVPGGAAGAAAIGAFGSTASQVRLDGGSVARGGSSSGVGGGAGASFVGSIALGSATLEGGAGSPSGPQTVNATVASFPAGFHLAVNPPRLAGADAAYHSGDTVSVSFGASPAVMLVATSLQDPPGASFLTLPPSAFVLSGNTLSLSVPTDPGISASGVFLYFQGFALVGSTSKVEMTHVSTIRIDL